MRIAALTVAVWGFAIAPAAAQEARPDSADETVCLTVESAARAHGLPVEFFARVIWRESRFNANAVGPLTRYGTRAQGIAQFMPGTAAERGLLDPFDPLQALPKAAEFLQELRSQFGNLGLAAAAYNAGPARVRAWLDGTGQMPDETVRYVLAITGHPIEEWTAGKEATFDAPPASCRELVALLKRAPNAFVTELERRVRQGAARPWGVQLAAGFSRDRALAAYARAMKRFSALLGGTDPMIVSGLLRTRGTRRFYQVRVGEQTRPAAEALCTRIRRSGGACLVLRTRGA